MEAYRSVVSLSKQIGLARNMLGGIFRTSSVCPSRLMAICLKTYRHMN